MTDDFTTVWDPGIEEQLDRYLEEHGREARYQVTQQTWTDDYTVRHIHEIRIADDVSDEPRGQA